MNKIYDNIRNNSKVHNGLIFCALFFTLLRVFELTKDLYILAVLSEGLLIAIAIKDLLRSKHYRIMFFLFSAFSLWAALTAIWSAYPFVTLQRAVLFFIVSSSAVSAAYLLRERKETFFGLLAILNTLVIVLSTCILFIKLSLERVDRWKRNGIYGFLSAPEYFRNGIVFYNSRPILFPA